MDPVCDPLHEITLYYQRHPQLRGADFTVTIAATPEEARLESREPVHTTGHQRLAWHGLINRLRAEAMACAALGVAWGCPQFGLTITFPGESGKGGVRGDIGWALPPVSNRPGLFSTWTPHSRAPRQHAPWAARRAIVAQGPSGAQRWATHGPHWKDWRIPAGSPLEAVLAAQALFSARIEFDPNTTWKHYIVAHEVHIEGPDAVFTPYDGINAHVPMLDHLRTAQRAASRAAQRWDFDTDADFTTAVCQTTTHFPEDAGAMAGILTSPERIEVQWPSVLPGHGFDREFAHEARAEMLAFAAAFMRLPGLKLAPLSLDLYINAIPGGEILMGMAINNTPTANIQSSKRLYTHESGWSGFLRDWEPRIAGLSALPEPTGLWRVDISRWHRDSRIVSAASAEAAVAACAYLWGEIGAEITPHCVSRLPTLAEMGITLADLEAA